MYVCMYGLQFYVLILKDDTWYMKGCRRNNCMVIISVADEDKPWMIYFQESDGWYFIGFAITLDMRLACEQITLVKWIDEPPLYQQQQSPVELSCSLNSCSRWCIETDSCQAISWEPSRCIEVNNNNSGVAVITPVFVVPKDRVIPGRPPRVHFTDIDKFYLRYW